jgi:hypothetical protein
MDCFVGWRKSRLYGIPDTCLRIQSGCGLVDRGWVHIFCSDVFFSLSRIVALSSLGQ